MQISSYLIFNLYQFTNWHLSFCQIWKKLKMGVKMKIWTLIKYSMVVELTQVLPCNITWLPICIWSTKGITYDPNVRSTIDLKCYLTLHPTYVIFFMKMEDPIFKIWAFEEILHEFPILNFILPSTIVHNPSQNFKWENFHLWVRKSKIHDKNLMKVGDSLPFWTWSKQEAKGIIIYHDICPWPLLSFYAN